MKRYEATFELTRMLSATWQNDEQLQKIIKFSTEEWEQIILVTNRHLLGPALYMSLKQKNYLKYIKNKQLISYLKELYHLNEQRNSGILKQINAISTSLGKIEIKPVLMKGAASLSEDEYLSFGERVMMDIDILVPENRIFDAINQLKKDSYNEIDPNIEIGDHWHHYRRLYIDNGVASLEVHRHSIGNLGKDYFPIHLNDEYLMASKGIKNALVIKPVYALYHSFIHSQISHSYHERKFLSLRHLHHFTIILQTCSHSDFEALVSLVEKQNIYEKFEEYLYVIEHFFGVKIALDFREIDANKKYLKLVNKRLNNTGFISLKIKIVLNMIFQKFSYKTLKTRYLFTHRFMLIYYIPLRFVNLLYLTISSKRRRENFIKEIIVSSN